MTIFLPLRGSKLRNSGPKILQQVRYLVDPPLEISFTFTSKFMFGRLLTIVRDKRLLFGTKEKIRTFKLQPKFTGSYV